MQRPEPRSRVLGPRPSHCSGPVLAVKGERSFYHITLCLVNHGSPLLARPHPSPRPQAAQSQFRPHCFLSSCLQSEELIREATAAPPPPVQGHEYVLALGRLLVPTKPRCLLWLRTVLPFTQPSSPAMYTAQICGPPKKISIWSLCCSSTNTNHKEEKTLPTTIYSTVERQGRSSYTLIVVFKPHKQKWVRQSTTTT